MIEPTPRAPDLEAGLAEIDRRLREIQDELSGTEPGSENPARPAARRTGRSGPLEAALQRAPRPDPPEDEPPNARPSNPEPSNPGPGRVQPPVHDPELRGSREELEVIRRELQALSELRDRLLSAIRDLVEGYQLAAQAQPGIGPRAAGEATAELTLSVGPFASLEEVRAFEQAVAGLPGVSEASLRGYEGSDRAIVDVRLRRADRPDASRQ